MHIVLMSASGGLKKVHREPTEIARYDNVTFLESTSIENPIFIIGGITDIAEFCGINYAYLPRLGRYYFVDNITIMQNGIMRIPCSIDVLMSHKSDIKKETAILARQSNIANLYFNDPDLPIENRNNVSFKQFPKGLENKAYYYLLIGG